MMPLLQKQETNKGSSDNNELHLFDKLLMKPIYRFLKMGVVHLLKILYLREESKERLLQPLTVSLLQCYK